MLSAIVFSLLAGNKKYSGGLFMSHLWIVLNFVLDLFLDLILTRGFSQIVWIQATIRPSDVDDCHRFPLGTHHSLWCGEIIKGSCLAVGKQTKEKCEPHSISF